MVFLLRLSVRGDVTTHGSEGDSLVKGKVLKLKAYVLSVLKGGHIGELRIGGALRTTGKRLLR